MSTWRAPAAVLLLLIAGSGLGCRAIESQDELQALAGELPPEPSAELDSPPATGASAGAEDLDGFPLVGTVFPGLRGGLHSSFCDPTSDTYSTCI